MSTSDPSFVHHWEAGPDPKGPTLLLLHGTGGTERDLLDLGRTILPGAHLLSPRGQVNENGALRFFRRLAEGVFDLDDLHLRTGHLAGFVRQAAVTYGFDPGLVIALGFSNGANMAASLLLSGSGVLRGGLLLHPLVPFEPDPLPDLGGRPVFIGAGRSDPLVAPERTERLAELLRSAGAPVTVAWQPGGHNLSRNEVHDALTWAQQGEHPWN